MKYRLIHSQDTSGKLLIDDIEAGLPNEKLGIHRKQPVYIGYNHKYFDSNGKLQVDESIPGYIDLAPSDKVELSASNGTIAGLAALGLLDVVEIADGELGAPVITSATFDGDGATTEAHEADFQIVDGTADVGDYTITLNGTGFTETDVDAGVDDSATIAVNLATQIDANADFNATASGDTVTVESSSLEETFTHSTTVTDPDGSINTTVASTGRVVIDGSKFDTTDPNVSTVVVRDDSEGQEVELSETDITAGGGVFTDSLIVIRGVTHGLGTVSGDVESVDVTADGQTDTAAITEL